MTLRQLQYATEVFHCGSLSGAAKTLFISQSALSFAIRELEQEAGITIFERSRQGMHPTTEGKAFLKKVREVLQSIEELENGVRKNAGTSKMRIATVQSNVLPAAFSRLTNELTEQECTYRMRCVMCENSQVIDLLANDECDLGFVYATGRQEKLWRHSFMQRGIEIIQVYSTTNLVIMREDDPLAKHKELSMEELMGHTFIFSGEDGLDSYSNLADYSEINFNFYEHPRYIDAQDSLLLNHLLHEGRSFTIGHRSRIRPYCDGLAFIPLRDSLTLNFWLLRPKGKPVDQIEARFIELMQEEAAKLG